MATITPDAYLGEGSKRALQYAHAHGNAVVYKFDVTLAAVAQNEHVAIGRIPAGFRVLEMDYDAAALGANTGLLCGYLESDDHSDNDDNYFFTEADTSSALTLTKLLFDKRFETEHLVILKQTGSGSATGLVQVRVKGIFEGGL